MADPDMVLLARLQFAFTVSFHIIFPAFTIGLASYLAMLEGLWLKTGRDVYLRPYRFWVKIFAVSFGMGVVSGLVMSYQFGTNWSLFSELTGNVLGPLQPGNVRMAPDGAGRGTGRIQQDLGKGAGCGKGGGIFLDDRRAKAQPLHV